MHWDLDKILEDIVDDHMRKSQQTETMDGATKEDLVDVLINAQKSGNSGIPLTRNNIKAVILVSDTYQFSFRRSHEFLRLVCCASYQLAEKKMLAIFMYNSDEKNCVIQVDVMWLKIKSFSRGKMSNII